MVNDLDSETKRATIYNNACLLLRLYSVIHRQTIVTINNLINDTLNEVTLMSKVINQSYV